MQLREEMTWKQKYNGYIPSRLEKVKTRVKKTLESLNTFYEEVLTQWATWRATI